MNRNGRAYLSQWETWDRFLTEKSFRDAFAGVDDLCRSLGEVSHFYQARAVERLRLNNLVDGYLINGWESTAIDRQGGLLDCFRYPTTDPATVAYYNQALYVAVKCRHQVVGVDTEVAVDFYIINERDLRGKHVLAVRAEDKRGVYVEKQFDVNLTGNQVYSELLVRDVFFPTRSPGYTTIQAVLQRGKKEVALGRDRVYAVAYDPNELKEQVAVCDAGGQTQSLLNKAGITNYKEHRRGRPDVTCLVMGDQVPPEWEPEGDRSVPSLLPWVVDGHTIVILKDADVWAEFLKRHKVLDYRGKGELDHAGYSDNYFVRQHPLFTGLPVNTAFNWEYQCLAPYKHRPRFGLHLRGEQCVVACYATHEPEMLTAVGIVPLGRGKIILSTLDLEAAIHSGERSSLVARQILLNIFKYATGAE